MFNRQLFGAAIGAACLAAVSAPAQAQQIPQPSIGSTVSVMDVTGSSTTRTSFWGNFQSLEIDAGVAAFGSVVDLRQMDNLSVGAMGQLGITYQEGGYSGRTVAYQQFSGRVVSSQSNF